MQEVVVIWIGVMSLWAFLAMGYDKRQSKRKASRVPEKNLWTLALIGGGIGAYLGMQIFRHKTRHTEFRVGFLLLALIYAALVLYLLGFQVPNISEV